MTYEEFEAAMDDLRTEQECSPFYETFFPEKMVRFLTAYTMAR